MPTSATIDRHLDYLRVQRRLADRTHSAGQTPGLWLAAEKGRFGAGRVAICGSLYLAGEVLGASRETWPE